MYILLKLEPIITLFYGYRKFGRSLISRYRTRQPLYRILKKNLEPYELVGISVRKSAVWCTLPLVIVPLSSVHSTSFVELNVECHIQMYCCINTSLLPGEDMD